ncbi:hypothetical protein MGG_01502 [Pyricularia oryzae 70-15]|uniref:LysM domain-containing protein n=3 Tax=Pyricularia oryzae TaxID=318829 RepID=G4MT07_PYRO7|nr:uncharacterized protein MGG_01502 [Pyricularia oryzae 70-15]EHA54666.1 hypothetical protein MGG_01502 [Pyricularia oryzae 70-15]ELQ45043.1 hypothetical protein OOU_Y34scaffold00022g31 [Pyricularia oryzae Y34]KAI7916917.1 hypothetical protein M9X92_007653 [Pyricularia oryzae]KAI7932746.1 hypothetical protein M0657_000055 [Pyricularia oryzae]
MASSGLLPIPSAGSDSSNRPRNRRVASSGLDGNAPTTATSTSLLSAGSTSSPASRRASPGGLRSRANSGGRSRESLNSSPARRREAYSINGDYSKASLGKGLFDGSWAPSWASVQGLASSLLSGDVGDSDRSTSRNASQSRRSVSALERERTPPVSESWGPTPPSKQRPRLEDVAAGSLAEREAALRAVRTASVLESHEGVNGGLDITRRYKKRSSDEDLRGSARSQEPEEYLAYIHHVQKDDTYAGIVLKYRCREDAFRKSNGLWSRDNITIRKYLVIPVDTCEIKGRACDPPSYYSKDVDLLAPTPATASEDKNESTHDDFFAPRSNGKAPDPPPQPDETHPWTHVRWVSLESFSQPVEIARVSRRHTGYFPPRRKKSQHTLSTLSTPRESLDMSGIGSNGQIDSPNSTSSRRPSIMSSGRPPAHACSASVPSGSTPRSRGGSVGPDDPRPAWMRRPGGIGSLGKQRAPGPDKDYFNSFARKHFPGINIDSMPSMSVMGSETARFGFTSNNTGNSAAGIVESPFKDGDDVEAISRQGTGLDKAAAAVEMWLRGAFAKRPPGTPNFGARRATSQPGQHEDGISDLIELEDTNSEDGRSFGGPLLGGGGGDSRMPATNQMVMPGSSTAAGSSGWSGADGATLRGKPRGSVVVGKGKRSE